MLALEVIWHLVYPLPQLERPVFVFQDFLSTYTQHYYQEEKDADNSTSLQNWKLIHEDLVAAHLQCEGPEFRVEGGHTCMSPALQQALTNDV